MALTVSIEEAGAVKVLKCTGYIDSENSEILKRRIEEAITTGGRIVVDLEKIDYVSSAGWGIFVGYLHDARKNNGDIRMAAMKKEVLQIYELLDFTNIFRYFLTSGEAIKSYNS
jgi:anti-sigma B factor antagonist